MDLIIIILPVVTKDLPISPRFTPFDFFYRDASSALLQLVNQWLNFTYSRSHAFRYERKNTNPTLVRIELTTSALAGVQVTYYNRPLGLEIGNRFYRTMGGEDGHFRENSDEGGPSYYLGRQRTQGRRVTLLSTKISPVI